MLSFSQTLGVFLVSHLSFIQLGNTPRTRPSIRSPGTPGPAAAPDPVLTDLLPALPLFPCSLFSTLKLKPSF